MDNYIDHVKQYGSVAAASRALGIPRTTYRRRLKEQAGRIVNNPRRHPQSMNEDGLPWVPRISHADAERLYRESDNPPEPSEALRRLMRGDNVVETALLLYDVHIPNHCQEHIEIAIDYALTKHPRVKRVILGGDLLDCHTISRWKKDPFGAMPLHEEIDYAVTWLEKLRIRFPERQISLIKGNHEDRLETYLWNQAPEISRLKGLTIPDQLELKRLGIQWVDNLKMKADTGRFWSIGALHLLHGHELGICPSVNPARQYFLRALDNVCVGHVHKVDDHYANTVADKTMGAFVVGTMADMHPDYRPQNDWVAGFGLCSWDADGMFSMKLKKIIEKKVL